MKKLSLAILLLAGCTLGGSLAVNTVNEKSAVLYKTVVAYNPDAVVQSLTISPNERRVAVSVPAELHPYIARDSLIPFPLLRLSWSYKDLGADSAKVIAVINLIKAKLDKQITLKKK